LENGRFGVAFSSGLATTASVLHLLKSGDEIIAHVDMYGGTNRFFHRVAAPYANLKFTLVDMRNPDNLVAAISDKTKVERAARTKPHHCPLNYWLTN
jgi:cystathionine gamma-lyase